MNHQTSKARIQSRKGARRFSTTCTTQTTHHVRDDQASTSKRWTEKLGRNSMTVLAYIFSFVPAHQRQLHYGLTFLTERELPAVSELSISNSIDDRVCGATTQAGCMSVCLCGRFSLITCVDLKYNAHAHDARMGSRYGGHDKRSSMLQSTDSTLHRYACIHSFIHSFIHSSLIPPNMTACRQDDQHDSVDPPSPNNVNDDPLPPPPLDPVAAATHGFCREILHQKIQHSQSQEAITNMMKSITTYLTALTGKPELASAIIPADYQEIASKAYEPRWQFEHIDVCATCWKHHWRGIESHTKTRYSHDGHQPTNIPFSRTCPVCHWPRYKEDLCHYYQKLNSKTKFAAMKKTSSVYVDQLKLIASTLPTLHKGEKLTPRAIFRYINPATRIQALFKHHRGFAMAVRDGYNRWKQVCRAKASRLDADAKVLQYVNDIHDAEVWDEAMIEVNSIKEDARNLVFGLCADSADLHAYGRSAKIKPLVLTNYGFRRRIRSKAKYLWMLGIPPKEHKSIDVFLRNAHTHTHTHTHTRTHTPILMPVT
jgi:hypothetical protein